MTKQGEPCRAPARGESRFCAFHDPARADEIKRGREAGGRERCKPASFVAQAEPDLPTSTAKEIGALIGDTISRVRKGTLDPKVANTIGYLATVALRAIDAGDMSERLERLEAAVAADARVPPDMPWSEDEGDEELGSGW